MPQPGAQIFLFGLCRSQIHVEYRLADGSRWLRVHSVEYPICDDPVRYNFKESTLSMTDFSPAQPLFPI